MTGTQSRQWASFLTELNKQDIEFDIIQHADENSRLSVLNSLVGLSPMDRAVISSTWTKLAQSGGGGNNTGTPAAAVSHSNSLHISNNQGGGDGRQSTSSNTTAGMMFEPVLAGTNTHNPVLVERSSDAPLQSALNRGDCAAALPLASEMLQQDPSSLVSLLHEHLPHISADQLRNLLGLGGVVPQPAGSPAVRGGGDSHLTGMMGSPPRGGPTGGHGQQAYINGNPIAPGQLLTSQSVAAQFGTGFTATCNGQFLHFPYCVQREDQIVVRPLNERHL